MRIVTTAQYVDQFGCGALEPHVETFDWKASGDSVLDVVDRLLSRHGLEILRIDTSSDEYAFAIEER